jgi:hypothetical protein
VKAKVAIMKLAFKYAFSAIPVMLSLAAPVAAGSRQNAMAAYAKGDYATALRLRVRWPIRASRYDHRRSSR